MALKVKGFDSIKFPTSSSFSSTTKWNEKKKPVSNSSSSNWKDKKRDYFDEILATSTAASDGIVLGTLLDTGSLAGNFISAAAVRRSRIQLTPNLFAAT